MLRYGSPERRCEMDDRTLAHVAVVIFDELRWGEGFSFSLPGDDQKSLWVSRSVALRFDFDDSARVSINRDWVVAMEHAVHTVHKLRLIDEPTRPLPRGPQTTEG